MEYINPIPIHLQPAYANEFKGVSFPITERLSNEILSLPMYPGLTNEQIEYIGRKVNEFFR